MITEWDAFCLSQSPQRSTRAVVWTGYLTFMFLLKTEVCKCTPTEYGQHPNLFHLHFTKILLLQQRSQILEKLERQRNPAHYCCILLHKYVIVPYSLIYFTLPSLSKHLNFPSLLCAITQTWFWMHIIDFGACSKDFKAKQSPRYIALHQNFL